MKSFKNFINSIYDKNKTKTGVIPEPIHFKHIGNKKINTTPDYIHFKNVNKDEKKKDVNEAVSNVSIEKWKKTNDNKHLGSSNQKISSKLGSTNRFNDDHRKAIQSYTGGYSGTDHHNKKKWHSHEINSKLIKGEEVAKKHQKTVKHLDSVVEKHPLKHEVHTYSGVSFDPRKIADKKGKIKSPAFISSTHNKEMAHNFARSHAIKYAPVHIIHFHLKPGDPATHISQHSPHGEEHETLIKRGVTLKHNGTDSHYDHDSEHWVHIHHMSIDK
jgi:ADP-ribosyltransferase exoenzyme